MRQSTGSFGMVGRCARRCRCSAPRSRTCRSTYLNQFVLVRRIQTPYPPTCSQSTGPPHCRPCRHRLCHDRCCRQDSLCTLSERVHSYSHLVQIFEQSRNSPRASKMQKRPPRGVAPLRRNRGVSNTGPRGRNHGRNTGVHMIHEKSAPRRTHYCRGGLVWRPMGGKDGTLCLTPVSGGSHVRDLPPPPLA